MPSDLSDLAKPQDWSPLRLWADKHNEVLTWEHFSDFRVPLWPQELTRMVCHQVTCSSSSSGERSYTEPARSVISKKTDQVLICVESPSDIQRCTFSESFVLMTSHLNMIDLLDTELKWVQTSNHPQLQSGTGGFKHGHRCFFTLPSSELEWYLAYMVSRFSKRLNKEPHMFLGCWSNCAKKDGWNFNLMPRVYH